jgi:hypothetical protein
MIDEILVLLAMDNAYYVLFLFALRSKFHIV